MTSNSSPASRDIVELVRHKLGDPLLNRASDAAVARALCVSRVSVSRYMRGESIMETSVLVRANEFMQLEPDALAEFALRLQSEAVGQGRDMLLAAIAWIKAQKAYGKTAQGERRHARRAKTAAGLLAAGILGLAAPAPSPAAPGTAPASVYYGKRKRVTFLHTRSRFPRHRRPLRRRNLSTPAALPITC